MHLIAFGLAADLVQIQCECPAVQKAGQAVEQGHLAQQLAAEKVFPTGVLQKIGADQPQHIESDDHEAIEPQVGQRVAEHQLRGGVSDADHRAGKRRVKEAQSGEEVAERKDDQLSADR